MEKSAKQTVTAATKALSAMDQSGRSSKLDCSRCSVCARNQSACSAERQDEFCSAGCERNLKCNLALLETCDEARAQDEFSCIRCTGSHQVQLDAANCSNAIMTDFCHNKSCIAKLASSCGGPTTVNQNQSCFDCVQCANAHRGTTGCEQLDEAKFCEATWAPLKYRPVCEGTLAALCNSSRHSGGDVFDCIRCSGVHQAALDNANCSQRQITDFCSGSSTCYSTLVRACGHVAGTCGQCAECVANISTEIHCSMEDKRRFCESEVQPGKMSKMTTMTPS